MRALISRSASAPLAWAELPNRPLRPDEVRVEVRAVGVNPVDWKMRGFSLLGIAQRIVGPTGPFVCGVDFAGVVLEAGAAVSEPKVGDPVVGGVDFSRRQHGSYARTVQVRSDQVAVLPSGVAFDRAACLPVPGVTARAALLDLGGIDHKPDPRVLVLAASGGVGHLAVQLARAHGALAVGVCSSRNRSLVEQLGGVVIEYDTGDAMEGARRHGPYDVILDAVGGDAYPVARCLALLKPDGTHVLVMPGPKDVLRLLPPGRVRTILGRPKREALAPLVSALAAGQLEVVIAERIPLDEAERAQRLSRAGRVVGKLVLMA